MSKSIAFVAVFALTGFADAFYNSGTTALFGLSKNYVPSQKTRFLLRPSMQMTGKENPLEEAAVSTKVVDPEAVTKKYGLEAGIFTAITSKDKKPDSVDAKTLLAKYGSAYLLTSISLAAISFTICYVLVDNGIDVAALLAKIGITADSKTEAAGTVAIAYAAHKAASPIRFPPTVALTPITARYLFNRKESDESNPSEK